MLPGLNYPICSPCPGLPAIWLQASPSFLDEEGFLFQQHLPGFAWLGGCAWPQGPAWPSSWFGVVCDCNMCTLCNTTSSQITWPPQLQKKLDCRLCMIACQSWAYLVVGKPLQACHLGWATWSCCVPQVAQLVAWSWSSTSSSSRHL